MDEKRLEELIGKAIREASALPEGVTQRLEKKIERLAAEERQKGKKHALKRPAFYRASGIAATVLGAVILLSTQPNHHPHDTQLSDTYSDPQEAAAAARQALTLMSAHLNKGIFKVNETDKEINHITEIINKQFK